MGASVQLPHLVHFISHPTASSKPQLARADTGQHARFLVSSPEWPQGLYSGFIRLTLSNPAWYPSLYGTGECECTIELHGFRWVAPLPEPERLIDRMMRVLGSVLGC